MVQPRARVSWALFSGWILVLSLSTSTFAQPVGPPPLPPLGTTLDDFFQPGTQPLTVDDAMLPGVTCTLCHANYSPAVAPYNRWIGSLMAQATRDPLFHACLAIAEQDAAFSGDLCIRCHTPNAWLAGRSEPTDGSGLEGDLFDYDGVTCNFCHRMVDPVFTPGNPSADPAILADIDEINTDPHSGQFIVDPEDRRRGPFQLVPGFDFHEWFQSPFHQESLLCATCHDVSNPAFTRDGDSYVPNAIGEPHPTHDKYDEFPLERTFSEWSQSEFAQGPIDSMGRFGGNNPLVSSCQDCHMPDTSGYACSFTGSSIFRTDLPLHDFFGANTWVLEAILNLDVDMSLYSSPSLLTPAQVDAAIAGNINMLELASDMDLTLIGSALNVRITNETGHKFPTGYPEGRRMWLNVKFLDQQGGLLSERGHYDFDEATLTTNDTKVYEAKLGLDAEMSQLTGLPEGESFHFALNNTYIKDNRIPPRGFTNAGFESVQAAPVDYTYADGQYWDDTLFPLPPGTRSVEVALYYQTTSREYIEFLQQENVTNDAGQIAYDQWVATGKSEPVIVDFGVIDVIDADFVRGDCNVDGLVDMADPIDLLDVLFLDGGPVLCAEACDVNDDGDVDISDPIYELCYLYQAGPQPPAPFSQCGPDPTPGLGCLQYDACP